MLRYLLHLSYCGYRYAGWQYQTNTENTIQQKIEDVFTDLIKSSVRLHGCGRTDAGVHAAQYIAHISVVKEMKSDYLKIINHQLPEDIVLHDIRPVKTDFHAQTIATSRTYDYFISTKRDPFWFDQVAFYGDKKFDIRKMEQAVTLLYQINDFSNMCLQPNKHSHTNCQIFEAKIWKSKQNHLIGIRVTANRFLRGMMRILIANIMDVGIGKIAIPEFSAILKKDQNRQFKDQAYAQGLYLAKINYPDLTIPVRSMGYLNLLIASGGVIPS